MACRLRCRASVSESGAKKKMAVSRKAAVSGTGRRPDPVPLKPPANQTFSKPEWLANILRDRILSGHYRPGERLIENDLRQEFGFSNGPTREALHILSSEGLLERSPWQGSRVIDLSKDEIVELFQIRIALLEYAVELAAGRHDAGVMDEADALKARLKTMFAKARTGGVPDHHAGFLTDWIFRAAGNRRMQMLWNQTMLQSRLYVYASIRRSSKIEAPTYALVDAIVVGDRDGARKAARAMTDLQLRELFGG